MEEFMSLNTAHGRRREITGWNIAAAFGLLVAAFVVERLSTAENEDVPARNPKEAASAVRLTGAEDRGRLAASPSEIPAKGWKDILWRAYSNVGDHRILALAAGMTYYSLLAIFPALAALVAIYGLFSEPGTIAKHLDQMGSCRAVRSTWRASSSRVSRRKEIRPSV
jgi:membrane protein